jgi:hypothetical protein
MPPYLRFQNRGTDGVAPESAVAPAGGALAWPSERKLRLFACGCCRQWWKELAPVCRRAISAAERYADGHCSVDELETVWRNCRRAERLGLPNAPSARTTEYVHRVATAIFSPMDAWAVAADMRPWRGDSLDNNEVDAICERVGADVFGHPDGAVPLPPAWITPNVWSLARTVYDSRDFGAMPILADALQDAGCDNEHVLSHCRDTTAVHVRGCWVVDQILGKG